MRGALCSLLCAIPYPRIIPADAGSTARRYAACNRYRDHPRGCGEHRAGYIGGYVMAGSSPRMRGAHKETHPGVTDTRIIPADAGSTRPPITGPTGFGDHPRGCGEHDVGSLRQGHSEGSSPRMRGARRQVVLRAVRERIIPADAGSTGAAYSSGRRKWDHPRGCGEHDRLAVCQPGQAGSSPRMRGAPGQHLRGPELRGIIPADAGSTRPELNHKIAAQDHPRGCGEHRPHTRRDRRCRGSSPRMRGALFLKRHMPCM